MAEGRCRKTSIITWMVADIPIWDGISLDCAVRICFCHALIISPPYPSQTSPTNKCVLRFVSLTVVFLNCGFMNLGFLILFMKWYALPNSALGSVHMSAVGKSRCGSKRERAWTVKKAPAELSLGGFLCSRLVFERRELPLT